MKNKRKKVLMLVLLLAVFCLVLASCSTAAVNLDKYIEQGEDNLGVIAKLVMWMHSWIGIYGVTVIAFTVFLKLVMLPFDIWQRYAMRKSTLKMQEIQPVLDEIDKRYGANSEKAKTEKQKVQSKQSMSMLASCLPMIVTMIVFFIMFGGLREYATYKNVTNYYKMQSFYEYCLDSTQLQRDDGKVIAIGDPVVAAAYDLAYGQTKEVSLNEFAVAVASKGLNNAHASLSGLDAGIYIGIGEFYLNGGTYVDKDGKTVTVEPIKESFLWIQSIWQPDTWDSVMPDYNTFKATAIIDGTNPLGEYNIIRYEVLGTAERGWNGLMILPIMSIGLSFLSIFISQRMERKNRKGEVVEQKGQQAMTNKMNMILMPLMMAYFGFLYTGAFAVYMVMNYFLSIITSILIRRPVNALVEKSLKKSEKKSAAPKADYKR